MISAAFIMSCVGALLIILSKPIARGFRWLNIELGYEDCGIWLYRFPLILLGAFLLFRSLFFNV